MSQYNKSVCHLHPGRSSVQDWLKSWAVWWVQWLSLPPAGGGCNRPQVNRAAWKGEIWCPSHLYFDFWLCRRSISANGDPGSFFYEMIPKITQNCGLCPPVLAHHLWLCCIRLVLLPHKLQVKAKPNVCLYSQKVREQIVLHSEIIFSKNCCLILAIK